MEKSTVKTIAAVAAIIGGAAALVCAGVSIYKHYSANEEEIEVSCDDVE